MEEPILKIRVWVNGQISMAVARSYSQMIHGARVPSPLQTQQTDWELTLGLGLAQEISCAKIVLLTPEKNHLIKSTPPPSFVQHTLQVQHPSQRTYRTEHTCAHPDENFGVKTRPFGDKHGDFSFSSHCFCDFFHNDVQFIFVEHEEIIFFCLCIFTHKKTTLIISHYSTICCFRNK